MQNYSFNHLADAIRQILFRRDSVHDIRQTQPRALHTSATG
ncbi:hypothetical protein [Levilactobacillus brevis]|nr:hypothetical protein [Levilactobacillus brevis]